MDAPWIEVDTTEGYRPGLAEIAAFIDGQPWAQAIRLDEFHAPTA